MVAPIAPARLTTTKRRPSRDRDRTNPNTCTSGSRSVPAEAPAMGAGGKNWTRANARPAPVNSKMPKVVRSPNHPTHPSPMVLAGGAGTATAGGLTAKTLPPGPPAMGTMRCSKIRSCGRYLTRCTPLCGVQHGPGEPSTQLPFTDIVLTFGLTSIPDDGACENRRPSRKTRVPLGLRSQVLRGAPGIYSFSPATGPWPAI